MQRTIRDAIARVDRLLERIEQQSVHETKTDLLALRIALKGMLAVEQARSARPTRC